jgi:hypothetical protein
MDWVQFTILLIAMIGLFLSQKNDINANRTEAAADRRDMLQLLKEMKDEMKDFHGRLERVDAEFKAYLINEGRKK